MTTIKSARVWLFPSTNSYAFGETNNQTFKSGKLNIIWITKEGEKGAEVKLVPEFNVLDMAVGDDECCYDLGLFNKWFEKQQKKTSNYFVVIAGCGKWFTKQAVQTNENMAIQFCNTMKRLFNYDPNKHLGKDDQSMMCVFDNKKCYEPKFKDDFMLQSHTLVDSSNYVCRTEKGWPKDVTSNYLFNSKKECPLSLSNTTRLKTNGNLIYILSNNNVDVYTLDSFNKVDIRGIPAVYKGFTWFEENGQLFYALISDTTTSSSKQQSVGTFRYKKFAKEIQNIAWSNINFGYQTLVAGNGKLFCTLQKKIEILDSKCVSYDYIPYTALNISSVVDMAFYKDCLAVLEYNKLILFSLEEERVTMTIEPLTSASSLEIDKRNGFFIVVDNGDISIFSNKGEKIQTIPKEQNTSFRCAIVDENGYLYAATQNKLYCYKY